MKHTKKEIYTGNMLIGPNGITVMTNLLIDRPAGGFPCSREQAAGAKFPGV